MAITSLDGTVTQVVEGAGPAVVSYGCQGPSSGLIGEFQSSATAPGSTLGLGTHFFVSDHLGTAQMEFSAGGWPVWQGQFAPFGQELDPQPTANHYKFTGRERDAETQLDYFGARFLNSNIGRWMSPDWSARAEPVPYANLANPQTLNLYAYVGNNPLRHVDSEGHDWVYDYLTRNTALIQNQQFQQNQLAGMLALQGKLRDQQHHALAQELASEANNANLTIDGTTPYTAQYIYDNTAYVQTVGGNSDFFPSVQYVAGQDKRAISPGMNNLLLKLDLKPTEDSTGCESPCRSGELQNSPHYHEGFIHMDGFNWDHGFSGKFLHSVVDYIIGMGVYGDYPFTRSVLP